MANPKRKRRSNRRHHIHARRKHNTRRRRNPIFARARAHRGHSRRRFRRRNPFGIPNVKRIALDALWATTGGVLSRSLPQMVAPQLNTGITGYAMNGITAVASSMLASRFLSPEAGQMFLLGGAVMLGGRIIEDLLGGRKIVEFGSIQSLIPGMSGDPAYDLKLSGEFVDYPFAVPQSSLTGGRPALPAPLPMPAGKLHGAWHSSPWSN